MIARRRILGAAVVPGAFVWVPAHAGQADRNPHWFAKKIASFQRSTVFSKVATSRLCALDPLAKATRLPLRSASVFIGELAGTIIALVVPSDLTAAT